MNSAFNIEAFLGSLGPLVDVNIRYLLNLISNYLKEIKKILKNAAIIDKVRKKIFETRDYWEYFVWYSF